MAFREDAAGILQALSLLKLPPEPSVDEIRKAYFILVKQCHPDKGPNEEKEYRKCRTQDLNNAKDLLLRLAEKRTLKAFNTNTNGYNNNNNNFSTSSSSSSSSSSYGNNNNNNNNQQYKKKNPFGPSKNSSNFFNHRHNRKRKDDPFFQNKSKAKKMRFNRPSAAESKAGAAALNRSRSRRGAAQGKKRLSARDMMNQWKKNNASMNGGGSSSSNNNSSSNGNGNNTFNNNNNNNNGKNGNNSKTPAKIKEMEARNQAYLKQQEERARLVQQRLQQHKEKKKIQQKWAWDWQCKVADLQRQLSMGEAGKINVTNMIALEKNILDQPFYFNISINPRIEQSLRWLKEKQAECKQWCGAIERKEYLSKTDLKERIFFLRSLKRRACDIPVRKSIFDYLLETLNNEETNYKEQMEKLRLQARKLEERRRRDRERRRLRKLEKLKAKEEQAALLAAGITNGFSQSSITNSSTQDSNVGGSISSSVVGDDSDGSSSSSDSSEEESSSESEEYESEYEDEDEDSPKKYVMPKFYLKDLLDLDMCDEGWTVIEPKFFIIPGIFDMTKKKKHPTMKNLQEEREDNSTSTITTTTNYMNYYMEEITMFTTLDMVNLWRDKFSKCHQNARNDILDTLNDLRHQRKMVDPRGITEEAQFLKEAEEAAATGEGMPKVGDLVDCMRRKWPGLNDDGGLAKIVNVDEENETYDVKYILDNRRVKGIDFEHVKKHKEETNENSGRSRRGNRNRVKKEKITISKDGLKVQIDDFILSMKEKALNVQKDLFASDDDGSSSSSSGKTSTDDVKVDVVVGGNDEMNAANTTTKTSVATDETATTFTDSTTATKEEDQGDNIEKSSKRLSVLAKKICNICATKEAIVNIFHREAITIINCSQEDVALKRLDVLREDFCKIMTDNFFTSSLEDEEEEEEEEEEEKEEMKENDNNSNNEKDSEMVVNTNSEDSDSKMDVDVENDEKKVEISTTATTTTSANVVSPTTTTTTTTEIETEEIKISIDPMISSVADEDGNVSLETSSTMDDTTSTFESSMNASTDMMNNSMRSPMMDLKRDMNQPLKFVSPNVSSTSSTTTMKTKTTMEIKGDEMQIENNNNNNGEMKSVNSSSVIRSEAFTPSSTTIASDDMSKKMGVNFVEEKETVDPTVVKQRKESDDNGAIGAKDKNGEGKGRNAMKLSEILPPSWSSFLGLRE